MKSTAGFILGLIGGIGSAIWGILGLIWGIAITNVFATLPGIGTLSAIRFIGPIIILVGGGLAIWGALLMHKDNNAKVKKGGILTLIGGIIGFNILSLIGGILGLVSSGKTSTTPVSQAAPATKTAPATQETPQTV